MSSETAVPLLQCVMRFACGSRAGSSSENALTLVLLDAVADL
jgi:hypothetical protein